MLHPQVSPVLRDLFHKPIIKSWIQVTINLILGKGSFKKKRKKRSTFKRFPYWSSFFAHVCTHELDAAKKRSSSLSCQNKDWRDPAHQSVIDKDLRGAFLWHLSHILSFFCISKGRNSNKWIKIIKFCMVYERLLLGWIGNQPNRCSLIAESEATVQIYT